MLGMLRFSSKAKGQSGLVLCENSTKVNSGGWRLERPGISSMRWSLP